VTSDQPALKPQTSQTAGAPRGAESILLVEDEDVVRTLVRLMLEKQGYAVVEVADPLEALTLSEGDCSFDLLVTDVVMPGMNGHDLATQLVGRLPGLKVLFTSGYSNHTAITGGELEPGTAFLQKPFVMGELAAKVRDLLDAPPLVEPLLAA
jgi:CheY-like chemotaxis protein